MIRNSVARQLWWNSAVVRVVLFDFRKAVDLIDHNILVRKLSDYDISNHILLLLTFYQIGDRELNRPRNHEYYKNAHWLYTIKNFKLSAVRLQPSMDKMDKDDNYLYTKKGETNKKNI